MDQASIRGAGSSRGLPYHPGVEVGDDLKQQPWWRFALRVIAGLAALLVLVAAVVGVVALVVGLFAADEKPEPPVVIDLRTPPPADHARTPSPYAPVPWPSHPKREARGRSEGGGGGGGGAAAARLAPSGSVGMSLEEYREAIRSGQRIVLPDPKGECDLGGQDAARSVDALERCFAERAAR